MANAFYYSNIAAQTALSGSVSSGATSIGVSATTGFPGSFPYVLALDYGSTAEELVVVTAVGGLTLTVSRGFSGTSAQSHSTGAVVRHVFHAGDATDFRTHEAATGDTHGVTGALVGATTVQTLTNKTLTSPVINSATIQNGGSLSGTFTGSPTLSGAVTLSGGPNITNGGALSGTFSGAHGYSGAVTMSGGGTFTGTYAGAHTYSGNVTHTGEIIATNLIRGSRALVGDSMYEGRVAGDAVARWFTKASGETWWGSGSVIQDTNLYRSAVGTLKTDSNLVVTGALTQGVTGFAYKAMQTGAGTVNFSSSSLEDFAVVFDTAFSSIPRVLVSTTSSPSGSAKIGIRATNITTAGFNMRFQTTDSTAVSSTGLSGAWIAFLP